MAKPKLSSRQQPHQVLDLERYVPALLVFLANKLTSSASAIFRRQFGIGTTEWRVLAMVAVQPDITAGRICRVIGFDKAAVSRALAVLQQKALVQARSHETDGRSSACALTARGWHLHDRVLKIALEREQRLLGDLSGAERETLIGLLNRLHRRLPDLNGSIDGSDRWQLNEAGAASPSGVAPDVGRKPCSLGTSGTSTPGVTRSSRANRRPRTAATISGPSPPASARTIRRRPR